MQGKKEPTTSKEENKLGVLEHKRARKGPAERMWAPVKLKMGDNYNYVSKNPGLAILRYIAIFFGMPFVYLYYKVKWDLKLIGRKNVRLIRNCSAVTVANHVHNVDAFMLTAAFYPDTPYFVALKHNFEAFLLGGLVRVMRGIPLPSDIKKFERFSEQVSEVLRTTRHKIHIFPEAEIAPFSRQLRPFKSGAFHLAVKNDVPIYPMVFVFSARRKIRLILGKPIYTKDVPGTEGVKEPIQAKLLSDYTKQTMQQMMDDYYIPRGIDTKEDAK